tara:strand:- start:49 stop:507 length:459 start_codon:yes stop_codon:yes gene_type:complete
MKVQVYRNLHNGLISIQDLSTGLVLGHAYAIDLRWADFIVREAGRQQVIKEKRKNVHAFVRGEVVDVLNFKSFKGRSLEIMDLKHLTEDENGHDTGLYTLYQRGSMGSSGVTTTKVSYNPYKAPHFVGPEGEEVASSLACTIQSNGVIKCYT